MLKRYSLEFQRQVFLAFLHSGNYARGNIREVSQKMNVPYRTIYRWHINFDWEAKRKKFIERMDVATFNQWQREVMQREVMQKGGNE